MTDVSHPTDHGRPSSTPPRLGERLRSAREAAGLGLSDLASRTHVRRSYLEALEEGRYGELPEDVYARNFLRLYAQAVGLDVAPLAELYARERQVAVGRSTLEQRLDRDRRGAATVGTPADGSPPEAREGLRRRRSDVRGPALMTWFGPGLATLALVVVVVGLAAWGFDRFFTTPTRVPATASDSATATAPAAADVAAAAPAAAGADAGPLTGPGVPGDTLVRVELITDPPGAEITVDGFAVPGRTPLADVPLTARGARVIRAELDGYEPAERVVDLYEDVSVALTLTPVATAEALPDAGAPAAAGAVGLSIVDATWLEVYASDARNVGERLVYTTAQPGASYVFDRPVYVYVGNAAGVRVNVGGQDLGAMGAPGAVLGRAFAP